LHSVSTEDQLSFWSLTGAFMLKLIAIGITIFVLPFNEWIVSDATPGGKIFMRGVSGSDCIKSADQPNDISCIRWSDDAGASVARSFWAQVGLRQQDVQPPTTMHRLLYYFLVCQIAVFILDLGATTIMCCRYRTNKSSRTIEKRLSLAFSAFVLAVYSVVFVTMMAASYNFIQRKDVEVHLGTAFTLLIVAIVTFLLGWALSNVQSIVQANSGEEGRRGIQLQVIERWQKLVSRRDRNRGNDRAARQGENVRLH